MKGVIYNAILLEITPFVIQIEKINGKKSYITHTLCKILEHENNQRISFIVSLHIYHKYVKLKMLICCILKLTSNWI